MKPKIIVVSEEKKKMKRTKEYHTPIIIEHGTLKDITKSTTDTGNGDLASGSWTPG